MKKIAIINGSGGSGKDLFIDLATRHLDIGSVFNFSSIDPIKDILKQNGWDGIDKSDAWRLKMVNLKKELIARDDTPTRYLIDKINSVKKGVVFVHIREPDEIHKLKTRIPELYTIHMERPQAKVPENEVDQGTAQYPYDLYLINSGDTPESLEELARRFIWETLPGIKEFSRKVNF